LISSRVKISFEPESSFAFFEHLLRAASRRRRGRLDDAFSPMKTPAGLQLGMSAFGRAFCTMP
jgi:hypothetical protein